MARKILVLALVIASTLTLAACASTVKIKGRTSIPDETPLILKGSLMKPQGDGPFPAVVLLHGCNGIDDRQHIWAWRLKKWGYVSLVVDSLEPRGVSNVCSGMSAPDPTVRGWDAHSAKSYLAELPFVDRNRVAVMGWSHGGAATLTAADVNAHRHDDPFRAAIAFYPSCMFLSQPGEVDAPILILIGELDDWTSASLCEALVPSEKTEPEIVLKVYPGAYHCFDDQRKSRVIRGHWLAYHPAAAADAIVQVRNFLTKHLK
jgi:dienelactone hydrolase